MRMVLINLAPAMVQMLTIFFSLAISEVNGFIQVVGHAQQRPKKIKTCITIIQIVINTLSYQCAR